MNSVEDRPVRKTARVIASPCLLMDSITLSPEVGLLRDMMMTSTRPEAKSFRLRSLFTKGKAMPSFN